MIPQILKTTAKYLILFLIADVIFSNYIYKDDFSHSCSTSNIEFWELTPNCNVTEKYVKHSKAYKVLTDKNGLRFSGLPRDPKKKNIIFLGDSFTYGLGLSYEDTYIGYLEEKNLNYNLLNYGVIGYSPSVYHYQLNEIISSKVNFDKIILTLDISDFAEESSQWSYENDDKFPTRINGFEKEVESKANFKERNFKASRFVASKINNFFRNIKLIFFKSVREKNKIPGRSEMGRFLYTDIKDTDQILWSPLGFERGVKKIEEKIKIISTLAKSSNAEFYILIWPWPDTLRFGQKKFNLEKFSKDLCIKSDCQKVINVIAEFENIKKTDKNWLNNLFIHGDLHTNKLGNQVIGETIMKDVFSEIK